MLMLIYSSIIQPKFDYAITIWGYTCDNNLHKIQRLQNRAARIVTGNYDYVSTRGTELVKRLKWMCVTQRRDYFILILMYKSIHGMAPAYLCNEITLHSEIAERTTRSVNDNNVYMYRMLILRVLRTRLLIGVPLCGIPYPITSKRVEHCTLLRQK